MTKNGQYWEADLVSSHLGFSIKHFGFSRVRGRFRDFSASVMLKEEDFRSALLQFEAKVKAVDTFSQERDKHLMEKAFFDANRYPSIKFLSEQIKAEEDGNYMVIGNLTLKGSSNPIRLKAKPGKSLKDPWGNQRMGLMMETTIDRRDWGLTTAERIPDGTLIIGREISIYIDLELILS